MKRILTEFESIDCTYTEREDGSKLAVYHLYKEKEMEIVQAVIPPRYDIHIEGGQLEIIKSPKRESISRVVVEESENYINGFKVIRFQTGEFGYRRESDGEIMPVSYDVAGNFNEYGLALVGRDTFVTWIDKDFRYLDKYGNWIDFTNSKRSREFTGFVEVNEFSLSETPLSKVCNEHLNYFFITSQGKKQSFKQYDGTLKGNEVAQFKNASFISQDIIIADGNTISVSGTLVLFARGFYCTFADLIKLNIENGYLSKIAEQASKHFTIQPVNPDNKES